VADRGSEAERIAAIRRLFSEHQHKMFSPRRLGGQKDPIEPDCWIVRYARNGIRGGVSRYGIGVSPIDAAENAWANFQDEQP
jgi:hypothetical protein